MPTYDTPGHVSLKLRTAGGVVEIESGDGTQTDVELQALRDDEVTLEAIRDASVGVRPTGAGHEVYVELPKRRGFLGRGPRLAIRVRCPHGADVDCASSSGDLSATGSFGAVTMKTASGDVFVDECGELQVASASGDVHARRIRGRAAVNTASGDVRIEEAGGPVSANAVSGDVHLGETGDSVVVTTVSGDQTLALVSGGDVRLQSVSGDVLVGVAPGLRVWIDAASVSGSTASDLAVSETEPAADGPSVEVRAKTVSGDVRISRSTRLPSPAAA